MRAIADTVNGRIVLVNADGSVAAMFGAPAPGPTLLPDPVGSPSTPAGLIYVVDQERSRVLVFDRDGTIVRTIGSRGRGAGQLLSPSAVAVSAAGTVYVADEGNGRIVRFTTAGTHLGSFGRFRTIRGVAVSPDGSRVYGVRRGANRITVSTAHGRRPGRDRRARLGAGRASIAGGIAIDGAGNVWVADRGNDRVQALLARRSAGRAPSASAGWARAVHRAAGVSVACNGLVTVADADNNRVQQFQFPPAPRARRCRRSRTRPTRSSTTSRSRCRPRSPCGRRAPTRHPAIRQLPLRVSSDLPAKISIQVTLKPRSGKRRPSVRMSFSPQNLPAGKTVTYRPRLSTAGVRTLRRASARGEGLVAEDAGRGHDDDSSGQRRHTGDKCDGLSEIWPRASAAPAARNPGQWCAV